MTKAETGVNDVVGRTSGRLLAISCAMTLLSGCSNLMGDKGACSAAEASALVGDEMRDAIINAVTETRGRTHEASRSKIRASVAGITFRLEKVRTSKDDPNSTKAFCVATARAVVPVAMIDDAERAVLTASDQTLGALADELDIDRKADAFEAEIEYAIQPTDDGKSLFAELEQQDLTEFLGGLVSLALGSKKIERAATEQRVEEEKAAAAARAAERKEAAAIRAANAAVAAQSEAEQAAFDQAVKTSIAEARLISRQSRDEVQTIWNSVPIGDWGSLAATQDAWRKRRDAQCQLEGVRSSPDKDQQALAILQCDARMNRDRAEFLQGQMPGD